MNKRNKILIITAAAFVLTAVVFLIVGFSMAGVNILEWFSSKWAMAFYITFGVYGLFVIFLFIGDYIKRL